jgi:HD-GYP domain-containing protein (c-di-GMP phosphodiesterase class II)
VGAKRRARRNVLAKLAAHQAQLSEHSKGVAALARAVAGRLGLMSNDVEEVVLTAELHDVGKLALPETLLEKAGPLDEEEWQLMLLHTLAGEQILSDLAGAAAVASLVRSTHERWDGRGYPDGLAGEEIPLASRVVFACDAFDAMRSARPYQRPKTAVEALDEVERCAGTQFDPRVVDALVEELVWSGRARRGGELVGSRRRA